MLSGQKRGTGALRRRWSGLPKGSNVTGIITIADGCERDVSGRVLVDHGILCVLNRRV